MDDKKIPSREKLVELFIDKDLTKQEIANMLGLKLDNIKYLMKKYDIRKKDFKKDIEVIIPDGSTEKSEPKTYTTEVSLGQIKDAIKQEAERIVNEKFASSGLDSKPEEVVPESNTESKVDDFFKSLQEDVAETDIPLDWQPTMNVLTRMYESGEDKFDYVKFYKSKGIIVNLSKKKYNKDRELQKIKFNINSSSFNYDVEEFDDNFVITISLV